ncbi:uncharacterized protein LOC62_04G005397 [Vanrija pseudolonga]|uniref:Uncharacterized protein n=1 Tax=Vanrija pseudolonga TaxID=143232 RepID=A0AAF1BI48_9TREE|nr:hypothetical protein LOC62_04G005397 [Vanrija pseudolonga]
MAYAPSSPNGTMSLSYTVDGRGIPVKLGNGAPIPNGQPNNLPIWPGVVDTPDITQGAHVITMSMAGMVISFHDFLIETLLQTQADPDDRRYQRGASLVRTDGLNPAFTCSGQWTFKSSIGANASYLAINGTMGYQQGKVSFNLSTAPPVQGLPSTVSTASAYSYLSGLYETPLDPAVQYTLSIIVGADGPVGIGGITLTAGLKYVRRQE